VIFIAVWYTVASNLWSTSEELWEGSFGLLASLIVTLIGLAMLKTSRMQDKWRKKLTIAVGNGDKDSEDGVQQVVNRRFGKRYAFFFLPFISVLREGLEAMVFLGGIPIGEAPSSIPLAAIAGIICGLIVGYLIYRGGNVLRLHWFFVGSTCFLLLIAAGLFSRSISNFEKHSWNVYTGALGAGEEEESESSFDVRSNVWNLGCCDPNSNAGWSIFKALFGWSNVASVGTVTSYCLYWVAVMGALVYMRMKDLREAKKDREEKGEKELEKTEDAFN
jgi:high-affinity iron transporter